MDGNQRHGRCTVMQKTQNKKREPMLHTRITLMYRTGKAEKMAKEY